MFALPLLAMALPGVTVAQAALLPFALYAPLLLLGLPAGALVDRARRRRVMLVCDAARFGCSVLLIALALAQALTLPILFGVVALSGSAAVFFQVAYTSYLPELVTDPGSLRRGNTRLALSESAARAVGPMIGGRIVGWFGPVGGLAAQALALVASFGTVAGIRNGGARPAVVPRQRGWMRRDITEGLRFVFKHPMLEPILLCGGVYVLFTSMIQATLVLYGRFHLGLSNETVGLVVGAAALGYPVGNLASTWVSARLGDTRALAVTAAVSVTGLVLIPVAGSAGSVVGLVAASVVHGCGEGAFGVASLTLRQTVTPGHLLGRMSAAFRFVISGAIPLGSLLASSLVTAFGLSATIWIGGVGSALCLPALLRRGLSLSRKVPAGAARS